MSKPIRVVCYDEGMGIVYNLRCPFNGRKPSLKAVKHWLNSLGLTKEYTSIRIR